jgi:hypothetical protein
MLFYISRRDIHICSKLGILISLNQGEILESPVFRKIILVSSPGEVRFCSSENKQDRRMAPRPKLFVSARILQEQTPQARRNCPEF